MMAEWHVSPDYIVNNWTEELLDLMVEKLTERKEREREAMRQASPAGDPGGYRVPEDVLFAQAKNLIEVVKQ